MGYLSILVSCSVTIIEVQDTFKERLSHRVGAEVDTTAKE